MTTLVLVGVGYVIALVFILALLTAAKRGDDEMARRIGSLRGKPETPPSTFAHGPIATAVGEELEAECVIVVVTVPGDPGVGIVRASVGAPGLLGSLVPVNGVAATGMLDTEEAAMLGLRSDGEDDGPWTFAHVPIAGAHDEVVGTVTVARHGSRAFTDEDASFVEGIARRGASRFARPVRRPPTVVSTR